MKKIISLVVAFAIALSLVPSVLAESKDIQVFWYTMSDVYLSSVRDSLNKEFEKLGLTSVDNDANGQQPLQTDQIGTSISSNPKVLAVNIVETGAEGVAQQVVDQAKNAGIPLIFFNRSIDQKVVESYDKCVFVGTNYVEAGQLQGDMIGDYLLANYEKYDLNGDGVISYVMFKGDESNQEAIARTKYGVENANAKLTAAGKPELKYYDDNAQDKYLLDQAGTWSRQAAQDHMQTLLSQYTKENNNMVELVIANNDEMAIGAIQALQAVGYNKGEDSTVIPVFGVDATADAKNAIADKSMAGSIKQDAEGMAEAVATIAKNLIDGKDMFEGLNENFVREGSWKVNIPYGIYTGQ